MLNSKMTNKAGWITVKKRVLDLGKNFDFKLVRREANSRFQQRNDNLRFTF